jgi:hypothetical protein
MNLTITKEKVLQTAKLGTVAKDIMKSLFPEAFITSDINECVKDIGLTTSQGYKIKIETVCGEQYVLIPLPSANRELTFSAFEYAKQFVSKYTGCYPVHYNNTAFNNSDYLYIEFHHNN